MYLVVSQPGLPTRWYLAPGRGRVNIGSALEGDIHLTGHNIAARHVRIGFGGKSQIHFEAKSLYGVSVDGEPARIEWLTPNSVIAIGPWTILFDNQPPTGIEPIDEGFDLNDPESRLVYADSLEERGRLAEAQLIRGALPSESGALAAQTPPAWRKRFLPIAIEACENAACPKLWSALDRGKCNACTRRVAFCGNIGAARELALRGKPVAVDPAVRRFPNDLWEEIVKRPVIDMGRPR